MSLAGNAGANIQSADGSNANPFVRILFDPSSLFRAIAGFLHPLSPLRFLILPAAAFAAFAALQNWHDLSAHIVRITPSITFFQHLFLSLFTVNLMKNVMTGATMSHFGVGPKAFGVQLFLGVLPRFYVPVKDAKHLEYRAQRICYSAPLLTQLLFFSTGILAWEALRHSGAGAADLMLVIGLSAFVAFLITANPLWPAASGYRWLSAFFKRPELRAHALRLLYLLASGEPAPSRLRAAETTGLLLFAILMIVYNIIFAYVLISTGAIILEKEFRGAGVIILCILLTSAMFFLATRIPAINHIRTNRRRTGAEGPQIPARNRNSLSFSSAEESAGAPDGQSNGFISGDFKTIATRTLAAAIVLATPFIAFAVGASGALNHWSGIGVAGGIAGCGALFAGFAWMLATPNPIAKRLTMDQKAADARAARDGSAKGNAAMKADNKQESRNSNGRPGLFPRLFGKSKKTGNGKNGAKKNRSTEKPSNGNIAGSPEMTGVGANDGSETPNNGNSPDRDHDATRLDTKTPKQRRPVEKSKSIEELNRVLASRSKVTAPHTPWRKRMIWLGFGVAFLIICLLPYPFDVGGEFTVQPAARAEIRARTDGEIIALHIEEGDWVEEGDLLATLSNWNEKRDVAVREEELKKLRADLETLKYGARNEEVSLARQKIAAADLRVNAARSERERQRLLYESNTISEKALEIAENDYRIALVAKNEAEAGLALVQSSAQESEIAAAEATIARNEVDLEFSRLRLEYTNIRATVSGQIVSSLKERPVGAFLPAGELFTEIEDNRTITAEVDVPETEIAEVEIGAEVELRPWSAGGESVTGIVSKIAPKAEERDFGRVIRVSVDVPNSDGFMAVNMTGQAKISVGDRAVWQVFSRTLVRFFTVELWSWVP